MNKQLSIFELGTVTLIAAMLWFTYSEYAESKQALTDRSAELHECQALGVKIKALRDRPDQATLTSHSARALAQVPSSNRLLRPKSLLIRLPASNLKRLDARVRLPTWSMLPSCN